MVSGRDKALMFSIIDAASMDNGSIIKKTAS